MGDKRLSLTHNGNSARIIKTYNTMEIKETIKKQELYKMLGSFEKVRQGEVKNELWLDFEHGWLLQSYDSPVVARCGGKWYFFPDHDYSNTTNRMVIRACGMNMPQRRVALEKGDAIWVNMD